MKRLFDLGSSATATAWYLVISVVMTWPLLPGLARDLPCDLGDPLLNMWILAWDAEHILRLLGGDWSAVRDFWHGNIFHPAPFTLAYSEHLFAQAVQIAPVYALTKNPILCHNLLFFSTFVLSALGTYLLVRDLTGSPRAAFVSGLFYGFALYRAAHLPHLQVLSSQWMPFALFGLRRYFETRKVKALAGATLALIAQNLSCGYYLLFFAPFYAAYALYEIVARGLGRDLRLLGWLGASAVVTAAATWPFVTGYRALRAIDFAPRSMWEIQHFSADVLSFFNAFPALRLWGGRLQAFQGPEGELFPGAIPLVLALGVIIWAIAGAWVASGRAAATAARWQKVLALVLGGVSLAYLIIAVVILSGFGFTWNLGWITIRVSRLTRSVNTAAIAAVLLLLVSPRARWLLMRALPGPMLFYTIAGAAAAILALGPRIHSMGRVLATGPYLTLYRHVPGFDGLRVPARFGMLVALFLAIVAGFGAATVERRWRWGRAAVLAAGLLFLVEATSAPLRLNITPEVREPVARPTSIETGRRVPPVYRYLATLPADAVIIEFPFCEDAWELQYVYYSAVHWRRIVNGYSGGFPEPYLRLRYAMRRLSSMSDDVWRELRRVAPTHAVVHEAAFLGDDASEIVAWLTSNGARQTAAFRTDRVFALPTAGIPPPSAAGGAAGPSPPEPASATPQRR